MTEGLPRYPGIDGRVAVVTGGSRGIGAALCRLLAELGASVVVNGRDEEVVNRMASSINENGGRAHPVVADVTDADAVAHLRAETERVFGPADLLAAVAGVGGRPRPIEEVTPESWRKGIEGNLTSVFLTLREFLPGMEERRRGAVVTVSSTAGRLPFHPAVQYSAAKAGMLMLTREAASQAAESGVRVNALAPGTTMNDSIRANATEEMLDRMAKSFPLGRLGRPEDTAEAAAFLLSDAASWITGVTPDVAGGKVML
jgi:3-oxoacyl-[acyl-carrier protein] reductase